MGVSSTEKSRLRRQRIKDGRRLISVWLDADQVDALADFGLIGSVEAVDATDLNEAIRVLARGLCRRGISIDSNWAMTDALAHNNKPRGERIVAQLAEHELLSNGYRSAFGCPRRRVLVNIETV